MQFSHRISAMIAAAVILLVIHFVMKGDNREHEENPEQKILSELGSLETKLSEFEAVVQSYRADLLGFKEQSFPTHLVQNSRYMGNPGRNNRLKTGNIFYSLPHLMDNEDGLVPALTIGKERVGVSMVMGIPTVKRPTQNYLMTTLDNLLSAMTPLEKNDSLIIVFIAETDVAFVQSTVNLMTKQFHSDINTGLLEVFSPSQNFYPDLNLVKGTLGDSDERTRWRTKQNLDYAYMLLYAQHRGTYYIQLEDDVLAKKGFVRSMKLFARDKTREKEDWFMLDFCQLGFIGKLFRSSDLWKLAEFFLLFYQDKPGDWLLSHFFSAKYCKLDQNNKKCTNELKKHWIHYRPSLFQHIGMISSLNGKVQKLKDRQYGRLELFIPHSNPLASKIDSNIQHYGKFSLVKAYEGHSYFWGLSPKVGDFIQVTYDPPIAISKYRIVSGNAEHPSDKMYNCTLEVMPSDALKRSNPPKVVELNEFDELGRIEGTVPPNLNPIQFLRLSLKSASDNWLILSEIYVEVGSDF